jgi:2-hydroxychromene-2-carboxylate isomerase
MTSPCYPTGRMIGHVYLGAGCPPATGGCDLGALVHGFLLAVLAEERDIAEDAVVTTCSPPSASTPDPGLADGGMLTQVETLERNTDEALRSMVFGAQSYVVGDEVFWGQPLPEAHLADLAAA